MSRETLASRLAWARAWRIRNKPFFGALYPAILETEPRRWREANKAQFDAIYGAS